MPMIVMDSEIAYIERGRVWRVEAGNASIAAGADHKIGLITGNRELVVLTRVYVSTATRITPALYEVSFTGGSTPNILNRRLSCADPVPFTAKSGVTATLGTAITQATIIAGTSTGNANANFSGDTFAVILKANTSYVISLLNSSAQTAEIDMAFDCRTIDKIYTHDATP